MHPFQRPRLDELVHFLTSPSPPRIVALTGPRQTGKTTMIRQALRRVDIPSRYFPVDESLAEHAHKPNEEGDSLRTAWLLDVWKKARRDAEQSARGFILALDEIQYVKGWSTIVKVQWDRDRRTGCPLRVIVSGSAPWSMLTGFHESLAGRFMPVRADHWSFSEMSAAFGFSIDEYLFFGGYPGTASVAGNLEVWRKAVLDTIIAPAIERDIVALTRVDKPSLMRRLMELAARYSGQMLSYNKMLGQLQEAGNTTTLAAYLDLLSDAGLVTGLPGYSAKPYLGRASSPKLNVLNTALMTAPLTYTFEEARADRTFWGRLVESGVGAHLHNTAGHEVELSSWRDGAHEVDFVLSRGPNLVGIEVKSGPRLGRLSGLAEFRKRFPGARTLVVGDRGVPLAEFLSHPARYWADNPVPSAADGAGESRSVREPSPGYGATLGIVPGVWRPDCARAGRSRGPDPARPTNQAHGGRPRARERAGAGPGDAVALAYDRARVHGRDAGTLRGRPDRAPARSTGERRGTPGIGARRASPARGSRRSPFPRRDRPARGGACESAALHRHGAALRVPDPGRDGRNRAARRRCAGRARCGRGRPGRGLLLHDALRGGAGVVSAGHPGAPGALCGGAGHGAQVAHPPPKGPQQPSLRACRRLHLRGRGAAGRALVARCLPHAVFANPRCRPCTRSCGPRWCMCRERSSRTGWVAESPRGAWTWLSARSGWVPD